MEKKSTSMTFLKAIMTIFIIILSIHFWGFLLVADQIRDVNELEENVYSIKASLQTTIGSSEIENISLELTASEGATNKKKQPTPHPHFVANDAVQTPKNIQPVSKPLKKKEYTSQNK